MKSWLASLAAAVAAIALNTAASIHVGPFPHVSLQAGSKKTAQTLLCLYLSSRHGSYASSTGSPHCSEYSASKRSAHVIPAKQKHTCKNALISIFECNRLRHIPGQEDPASLKTHIAGVTHWMQSLASCTVVTTVAYDNLRKCCSWCSSSSTVFCVTHRLAIVLLRSHQCGIVAMVLVVGGHRASSCRKR